MLKIEVHGDPGEGKTTIASLIAHYLQVHGFRVDVHDTSIPNRDALRSHIRDVLLLGMVGQTRPVDISVVKAPPKN
jgi:hypothetical protein